VIRKPEPKEAAKAIVAMFAAKGIDIKRSLALEVVAAVEGYNDWNTMAATLPAVKAGMPKPPRKPKYPAVHDEDGPFTVQLDGAVYDTLERFKRAQDVAEMFAAELESEYIATIVDTAGQLRAMYVGDHTRYRVYFKECVNTPVVQAKQALEAGIENDADMQVTCFGNPDNFYDHIVERAESGTSNMTFMLGYRAFDTDPSTGRVDQADLRTPVRLGLLVVHGELRYVCTDLPVDIRERISALFNM